MATAHVRTYSIGTFLMHLLLGVSVGAGVSGFLCARFISWWATPGYMQHQLNCAPAINDALSDLLRYMLIGSAIFAVLIPSAAYFLFYRRKKGDSAPPEAGTAPV